MKKYMRMAGTALCVLLMVCFYYRAVSCLDRLKSCKKTALILMESSPLNLEQVRRIRRNEEEQDVPGSFTAWRQENEVTVQNRDLQRRHTVSVVAVCGRSDLLLQGTGWLDETDREGCLIDEKTARALFGSTNVEGLAIEVGKEEKIIRGILKGVSDAVLYEETENEKLFTNLTVYMENGTTYDNIRQDFMMRYALEGRFVRMDILERLAGFACLKFSLPQELIPTKWSDFGFWSEALRREKESLLLLMLSEKQKPMEIYRKDFYQAVGCGLAAVVLAIEIMKKIRRKHCGFHSAKGSVK